MYDGSGKLTFNEYDFKGNLLEKTRRVIKDTLLTGQTKYVHAWNTLDVATLDSTEFKTNSRYDALNRPVEVTYPQDMSGGRKKVHPEYNTAGALERLKFAGATAVSQIAYNAKGQRTMMVAGGLMTRYVYDSETFRLTRIRAEKFANSGVNYGPSATPSVRLDRGYSYDLMGSVTGVHDKTPGDSASRGPNDKQWVYSHDPLRRLISATGRQQTDPGPVPPWQDINFTGSENLGTTNDYLREYKYDKQGNILELKHTAVGHLANGFTRYFNKGVGYVGDNLLNSMTIGDPPNDESFSYSYDANGNLIQENTDRYFEWNYADKLAFFKRQAGGGTPSVWVHYLYDNEGNRIKKFVNKGSNIYEITIYIDGIYEYSYRIEGTTVQSDHNYNTLHIMDGSSRIATVRVGNHTADTTPAQKFFVEDHLGNASVVVNTSGARINLEEYYPFGETSFGSYAKKRYRYNGKEKDEHTGLYEYGQRYYAPWLCRFVSVDPVAEDYPQYTSYNYAGNKPVSKRDLEGLQEENAESIDDIPNVNFDSRTSTSDQDFINHMFQQVSNSPLFETLINGISVAGVPVTVDTVDLDFMGFQAMFKPNLLQAEIPEPIEMGDDDTDSTWVVYPDIVPPANTRTYSGELTFNMSVAGGGNVHDLGFEFSKPFYTDAVIEEFVHLAQYSFYTFLNDSNLKDDYPPGINIEVEAKIITGMIKAQLGIQTKEVGDMDDKLSLFGERLIAGTNLDFNAYNNVMVDWKNEQVMKGTIYADFSMDTNEHPTLLHSIMSYLRR